MPPFAFNSSSSSVRCKGVDIGACVSDSECVCGGGGGKREEGRRRGGRCVCVDVFVFFEREIRIKE